MNPGTAPFLALIGLAALLAGCEDPLMPDTDEVILTSRADGGSFSLTRQQTRDLPRDR